MAAWTLCTSGSAIVDAGKDADTTCQSGANFDAWSEQVEGRICAECHSDFVSNYSSYGTEIKNALADIASAMVAKKIVIYNPNAYPTMRIAETILDVLDERETKGLAKLKEKEFQKLN
jgi:hypothetical protein